MMEWEERFELSKNCFAGSRLNHLATPTTWSAVSNNLYDYALLSVHDEVDDITVIIITIISLLDIILPTAP